MPLDLSNLLTLIDNSPEYRQIVSGVEQGRSPLVSVIDSAKPYLIASLYHKLHIPILLVTSQPETAKHLFEQCATWCPESSIRLFPEPEALPYERMATDNSVEIERLQALSVLVGNGGSRPGTGSPLVITSVPALMQKTLSRQEYVSVCHTIKTGDDIKLFDLLSRWQAMGYRLEATVDVPGTVSHRGGILDIFPPSSESPARLEFFGNTIESIRLFDPATQCSLYQVPSIVITPATELLALSSLNNSLIQAALDTLNLNTLDDESREQFKQEIAALYAGETPSGYQFYSPLFNRASLIDYLPGNGLIIVDEPEKIRDEVEEVVTEAQEIRSERTARRVLPGNFPDPYLDWNELAPMISGRKRLTLAGWGVDTDKQSLPFKPASSYAGQLTSFIQRVHEMLGQQKRVIVISHQASRLSELFEEQNIVAPVLGEVKRVPSPGSLTLVQGLLAEGWVLSGDTYLFTDTEIFGFTKQRRVLRRRPVPRHKLSIDIKPGDYVVHIEHGIARMSGVTTIKQGQGQVRDKAQGEREYLVLEYAAGDKLYVPADQIDRVTRYIGANDKPPALSRLGTQEWSHARQRVNEAVEKVAKELLALYATREVLPGFAFSRDSIWQQELEASFPYVETPDQLTVQGEVKEDMERNKPMDRLVCGDVGYGKTEIAVRSAFKAVMDHKQVAVLVPTTVLAEQHYVTFSQRFSAFPIKVEVLSRFRTHREQQRILDGLADGTVDICIGTHRLIQKDVVFKELGLLIIDEEQRFGVAHKEYLKKMRQEVDVLALSATPIPRTLHMSLVGVRDMSVMETPPEDRLPVKTYVAAYDDRLVREAIVRELERNGQVFFLHNRVQSINFIASKLKELVPEARFVVAHGQMNEDTLESVMTDFVQGKADVLVCTTIIESGLDMPNVNTLIVNQADRFGLTQLYQLRGRVGRGSNLAYAYFLYERGKRITELAEKRLNTIFEATELGAGFGIAMKDLEIRGAGNLLGLRQSGHISAVGFNLYTQLLARAVDELKARRAGVPEEQIKATHLPPPTIDLPLPAYIPEDYVDDLNTRIALYQKLVKTEKLEQIEVLAQEFTDRFGKLPPEVENLLYGVRVKILGVKAGIESIATDEGEIVLRRFEGMRFDRQKLEPYASGLRFPIGSLHIDPLFVRLNPRRIGPTWQKVLEEVMRRVG
jgi:transcription-repair coupling factor (superfamily II helicase)